MWHTTYPQKVLLLANLGRFSDAFEVKILRQNEVKRDSGLQNTTTQFVDAKAKINFLPEALLTPNTHIQLQIH